jgi:hypothetical protein
MIPKQTLIDTIEAFDQKQKQMDKDFEKETKETWSLEKFQEWRKMQKAWRKLQDVIEFEIKPLTE